MLIGNINVGNIDFPRLTDLSVYAGYSQLGFRVLTRNQSQNNPDNRFVKLHGQDSFKEHMLELQQYEGTFSH